MSSRASMATGRARRGFTLLESAAALVVIGLTSAAALGAFGADVRAASRLRHAAAAEALGQQRLATLRMLPRAELLRLPDSVAHGRFAPPLAEYHWRASAAPVRREDDFFQLRVEIAWADGAYTLVTRHYRPRAEGARR